MDDSPRRREYTVGQLAAAVGVTAKTVRYYGEIGLLPARHRTPAGYRLYSESDRQLLRFIVKAKTVGLSLDEIREVVSLKQSGVRPCGHVAALVEAKLAGVERQLHALDVYRQELQDLHRQATGAASAHGVVCGIIEAHEPFVLGEVARATPRALRFSGGSSS